MVQREYIVREVKVETLRRIIEQCKPAMKDRLVSFAATEWGTERRKALEYLKQLVSEQTIFIDGNEVWSFKQWQKIRECRDLDYKHMEDVINGARNKTLF